LHHEPDLAGVAEQARLGQRVTVGDHQVGEFALGDGAEVLGQAQGLRGGLRRGHQGLAGGKPVPDHPLDLQPGATGDVAAGRDL